MLINEEKHNENIKNEMALFSKVLKDHRSFLQAYLHKISQSCSTVKFLSATPFAANYQQLKQGDDYTDILFCTVISAQEINLQVAKFDLQILKTSLEKCLSGILYSYQRIPILSFFIFQIDINQYTALVIEVKAGKYVIHYLNPSENPDYQKYDYCICQSTSNFLLKEKLISGQGNLEIRPLRKNLPVPQNSGSRIICTFLTLWSTHFPNISFLNLTINQVEDYLFKSLLSQLQSITDSPNEKINHALKRLLDSQQSVELDNSSRSDEFAPSTSSSPSEVDELRKQLNGSKQEAHQLKLVLMHTISETILFCIEKISNQSVMLEHQWKIWQEAMDKAMYKVQNLYLLFCGVTEIQIYEKQFCYEQSFVQLAAQMGNKPRFLQEIYSNVLECNECLKKIFTENTSESFKQSEEYQKIISLIPLQLRHIYLQFNLYKLQTVFKREKEIVANVQNAFVSQNIQFWTSNKQASLSVVKEGQVSAEASANNELQNTFRQNIQDINFCEDEHSLVSQTEEGLLGLSGN